MSNKHAFEIFDALDPREVSDPSRDLAKELEGDQEEEPDEQERLDALLVAAWERMSARLKADRVEAWRRFQRTRTDAMRRPVREFCVTLRANDTRMDDWWGLSMQKGAIEERRAHTLWLNGQAVRDLTAPVRFPYPGVRARDAAAKLGMHRATFAYWVKHSPALKVRYVNAHYFGFDGKKTPMVWTTYPIDPCRPTGRRPHPIWGNAWQFVSSRIAKDKEFFFRREPRWQLRRGKHQFVGWDFICPGRRNARGKRSGCGRKVQVMYLPVPVVTIGAFLRDVEGFEVESGRRREKCGGRSGGSGDAVAQAFGGERGVIGDARGAGSAERGEGGEERGGLKVVGRWHPEVDVVRAATEAAGARGLGFACDACWRPQYLTLSVPQKAWHVFVRTMSGGLLSGRDVPMPRGMLERGYVKRRAQKRAANPGTRLEATRSADVGALSVGKR